MDERALVARMEDTMLRLGGLAGILALLSMSGDTDPSVAKACGLMYRVCEDAGEVLGDALGYVMASGRKG